MILKKSTNVRSMHVCKLILQKECGLVAFFCTPIRLRCPGEHRESETESINGKQSGLAKLLPILSLVLCLLPLIFVFIVTQSFDSSIFRSGLWE